jgi:hypothetical protein
MKKLGILLMTFFMVITFNEFSQAQQKENTQSPKATVEGKFVKIRYNRPSLRNRKLGTELAPYGKVWRTGADSTTKITFTKDVQFGGKDVKAGTYALFTVPNEKEWTVVLNNDWQKWGAYSYDQSKDVIRVNVPAKKSPKTEETFTIKVDDKSNNADLVMAWGDVMVAVPIKQK